MHFYRGSGVAAARYFDEGHLGAEAYYSEGGRAVVEIDTWVGGERAGTTSLVEPGDLVGWVEGVDPASGEVKGRIRSGGADRLPLRFVEVAVNNPKSLSIVASQNPVVADAVDRVLARQADEIAGYLSAVAVTRIGGRGAQVEVGGLSGGDGPGDPSDVSGGGPAPPCPSDGQHPGQNRGRDVAGVALGGSASAHRGRPRAGDAGFGDRCRVAPSVGGAGVHAGGGWGDRPGPRRGGAVVETGGGGGGQPGPVRGGMAGGASRSGAVPEGP